MDCVSLSCLCIYLKIFIVFPKVSRYTYLRCIYVSGMGRLTVLVWDWDLSWVKPKCSWANWDVWSHTWLQYDMQKWAKAGLHLWTCEKSLFLYYYYWLMILLFSIWTTVNLLLPTLVFVPNIKVFYKLSHLIHSYYNCMR